MYKVLYRAYRPEVFSEVLGQEHIVKILQSQLATDTVNHAYLFCGTRGTGKTTMARILAKGVNCTSEGDRPCGTCENCRAIKAGAFMDLVEIDAASNNGVENVRDLRESANYAPAVGKKKVYIIDEVHMMSSSAFNALLKTLEEPPETVMFILCTTEPEKLPATILSRCMRMDFRRVSEKILTEAYRKICSDRNVTMDEDALRLIVTNADGSVRDGLTILDQCIAGREGNIARDDVLDSLGAVGEDTYVDLTGCVIRHDPTGGLAIIEQLIQKGRDPRQILQGWMSHYRNLMMTKFIKDPEDVLNMSVENVERVREQSGDLDLEDINTAIVEIAGTVVRARSTTQPRILLEVCFVKLATTTRDGSVVPTTARAAARPAPQKPQPHTEKPELGPEAGPAEKELQRPEQVEPQSAVSQEQPAVSVTDDIEEIWEAVLQDGENQRGDFTMVRTGAAPVKMNDTEFVVSASGMAEGFIERNREMVAGLVAKYSGSPRAIVLSKEEPEEKRTSAEEVAQKVQQAMGGMKVDIE
ncbi:MAG: DNA polymerase III subunit gamma/tau [Eubacteriaceae bacterium]|nr:DNA polymerase III subunit gamma/tau [Eubacteriaceae bacterium]